MKLVDERHIVNVAMSTALKKLIIEHAENSGISFIQANLRLARIGIISVRRLDEMRKIVKNLERSDDGTGLKAKTLEEANTANQYIHLLKTLDQNVEMSDDITRFTIGVPDNFYNKMKKESRQTHKFMSSVIGYHILNGFIVVMQFQNYKKIISAAILNGDLASGKVKFEDLTNFQNFITFLEGIFAEVDGSQIEEFDNIKKKFFDDIIKENLNEF